MVPRWLLVALIACGVMLHSSAGEARSTDEAWVRIDTPRFVLYSNLSRSRAADLARELERLCAAVSSSILPQQADAPPTRMFVFRSSSSFDSYRDAVLGTGSDKDGIFISRPSISYVVIDGGNRAFDRVAFHEMTHRLIYGSLGATPLWINEGLAGLFESFRVEPGRARAAVIHRPDLQHLRRARIPLDEILSLTGTSEDFLAGARSRLIYAQTRLMMHYVLIGNPELAERLAPYLALLRDGVDPIEAFERGFGLTLREFERDLVAYAHRRIYGSFTFDVDRGGTVVPDPVAIEPKEILAELSGLLVETQSRNLDAAESLARASIELDEGEPRGYIVLGQVLQRRGELERALESFEQARRLGSNDPQLTGRSGRVALRLAMTGPAEERAMRLEQATELFREWIRDEPDDPDRWSALGVALSRSEEGRNQARAAFEKALSLDPSHRAAAYWIERLKPE